MDVRDENHRRESDEDEMTTWHTIDPACATCKYIMSHVGFNPPIAICSHEQVKLMRSTDMPACVVARSPHGRCLPKGQYYKGKA